MNTRSFEVIVVGAGLVGACCALALSRAGLRVALVDAERGAARTGAAAGDARSAAKVDSPAEDAQVAPPAKRTQAASADTDWDSRIYAISPASVTLLERLDAWHRVSHARAAACTNMRIFGDDPRAHLDFSAYEVGVPALATMMESRALARALDQALDHVRDDALDPSSNLAPEHERTDAAGNASLVTRIVGARVVELVREQNRALLRLDSGEQLECALVVGADGVHSQVRLLAGMSVTRDDYGELGVVANFAAIEPHRGYAFQWFRGDSVLAFLPLPGRRVSMVWSTPRVHAESLLAMSNEALAEEVARASGHVLGALTTITSARGYPLARQQASRMVADRVVLIGDAAHVVHPLAGQGLNLGFGDVATLLETIAGREPYRDLGDIRLLRRYERARAEPIAAMRMMTHGLHWLYGLPGGMPKRLRTIGLNLTNRLPVVRSVLARHAVG